MFGINNAINLAITFITIKFPEEMKNFNNNKFVLFETAEMIADELIKKHSELFAEDYIKDFVEIKCTEKALHRHARL